MENNTIKTQEISDTIGIIIPNRGLSDDDLNRDSYDIAFNSIKQQKSFGNSCIVVSFDENKGANFARNKGFFHLLPLNYFYNLKKIFELCPRKDFFEINEYYEDLPEYLLFSDNDIQWKENALEVMYNCLSKTDDSIAYCYCSYEMDNVVYCNQEFDANKLLTQNYISTMSLIKTKFFLGFDESIERLQDWDLWLNLLLNHNKKGIYCGETLFSTKVNKKGISFGNKISYEYARTVIFIKYGNQINLLKTINKPNNFEVTANVNEKSYKYHSIAIECEPRSFFHVSIEQFAKEVSQYKEGTNLYFDDGNISQLIVIPYLLKYKLKATFFIITSKIGEKNYFGETEIKLLIDLGFNIGSHTHTHPKNPNLCDLDEESIFNDIQLSIQEIKEKFDYDVLFFSPPHESKNDKVYSACNRLGLTIIENYKTILVQK